MKRDTSMAVLLCTVLLVGWHGALVSAADEPETVLTTFHAKPGAEAALAEVIADHFATARRLNPPAILAIWTEMAKLTEPRGGKPAIDIVQVALVR
jgi:hypothetical protein